MAKEIAFNINIVGSEKTAKTIKDLEANIKNANNELKRTAIGSEAYKELSANVAKSKSELDKLKKEQREVNKAFADATDAEGSYNRLSKQLGNLRNQFRALSAEERDGQIGKELLGRIQKLDTELKKTDATIGNFQRNIGDYENSVLRAFARLGSGAGNLGKKLGGLAGATSGIANIGFALQGAFAIGQAAIQAGKFINDFRVEIEETAVVVAEFGEVSGKALEEASASTLALSKTFGVSTEDIAKAAQQLSFELGVDFNTALAQIEQGLVNGQASNEDYLKSIAEFPSQFSAAGTASAEFSAQLQSQLDAEKELAAAQVELSKSFAGLTANTGNLGTQLKTGLLKGVVAVVEFFKPFVETIKNVGVEIGRFFGAFQKGNSAFELFSKVINFVLLPLKLLFNSSVAIFKAFGNVLKAVNNYIAESPTLQFVIEQVGAAFGAVIDFILAIPDALNQSLDAIIAFSRDAGSFLTAGLIDDSATAAAADAANKAGRTIGQELVNRYGEALQQLPLQTQQAIAAAGLQAAQAALLAGQSAAQAFQTGLRAADAAATAAGLRPVVQEVKKVEKRLTDEQIKAQKERAEKLKTERRKLSEDLEQLELDAAELLLQLTNQLNNERANLITDNTEKLKELERQRFKEQREQQQRETTVFLQQAAEAETEARRIYGEGSTELRNLRQKNAAQTQAIEQANFEILEAQEAQHQQNLKQIDADAAAERISQRRAFELETLDLQQQSDAINAELLQVSLQRRIDAAEKGSEKEKALLVELNAAQQAQIKDQIDLLNERQRVLQAQADAGVEIETNAFETIALEREKLNAELDKLTRESVEKDAKTISQIVDNIASFAQKSISAFSQVADVIDARRLATIEKEKEANDAATALLEERLANASGLEAAFVQQQIDRQAAAAVEIARKREQVERQAARRRKTVAIIESIINTAVEVTKVIANPILAAIVGTFGAIQTAVIAAQPLATGGKVKPYSNINGRINVAPNAPKSRAGDNTLIYAKSGEVVLNEKQQQRLGGAPILRSIGVPGFATGGLIGSQPPSPPAGSLFNSQNTAQAISAAVDNRLRTLNVELKTSDLERNDNIKSLNTQITEF